MRANATRPTAVLLVLLPRQSLPPPRCGRKRPPAAGYALLSDLVALMDQAARASRSPQP